MKYNYEPRAAAQSVVILINFEFVLTTPVWYKNKNVKWLHFKISFNCYIVTDSKLAHDL